MPPHPHHQSMPSSASMPLTVAALSGSSPNTSVPYYPQQQQQQQHMMHQQHMMMSQQQQQQQMQHHPQFHQQQQQQLRQQPPRPAKQSVPTTDPMVEGVTLGFQCDFCGGDEQENKATKLPEQMITCKVISIKCLFQ